MKIYQNTLLLLPTEYGIILAEKNARVGPTQNEKQERKKTMKIKTVKVKAGQQKLRERIKDALAKKGARASILINKLAANKKAVIWKPAELDAIALELRHLAFQIRVLKNAKTATEEA